jgi:succinate-acetate transporter protein
MQPLITYMQQLDSGQIFGAAAFLSLVGLAFWMAYEVIRGSVQLYADLAGQRAKEGKE